MPSNAGEKQCFCLERKIFGNWRQEEEEEEEEEKEEEKEEEENTDF